MNAVNRLIIPYRIVLRSYCNIYNIHKEVKPVSVVYSQSTVRSMAQRSITSFFKQTPPKAKLNEQNKDGDVPSAKRPRLHSSESDTSPQKNYTSPTVSSEKKTKVKRRRIQSSDSDSELICSDTNIKVESHKDDVKDEPTSPVQSTLKVERLESPKTYSSPKTKKKQVLVEQNHVDKSPIEKTNKTPPKKKETVKKDNSPSPDIIKKETEDKKVIKNYMFTRGKEHVKNESGPVTDAEYNPAKSKYHPIDDACWLVGAEVPYLALARTLELIEATSARLKIIEILSNYMRSVIVLTPDDLLPSIYLCLNQLAPAYHSIELGIAESYLMKAIGQCTGRTLAQVRAAASRVGDLALVAESARGAQRTMLATRSLTVRSVFSALGDIARITGHSSLNQKINKIQSLYVACRHSEARYLIRSLSGKLRIGLAEQSVLQALAVATASTPPVLHDGTSTTDIVLDASRGMAPEQFKSLVDEYSLLIKTTYSECPNYESIVSAILKYGVRSLPVHCRLTPTVPLKPMLAHPTRGVSDVFDRFDGEQFTCEWKYDGERAQIHVPSGTTGDEPDLTRAAIYSRNQENNTTKYPDILSRLPALLKDSVKSCVLDCEAVAYDIENKQILPFQVLSTRKRKSVAESEIKVQVCVFVFDLLYLNGEPLVKEPLIRRRELLREHFNEHEGWWQFAKSKDCTSVEEVQLFLEESVKGSCEGLMVKALTGHNSRYDIARRSHNWLKIKKDYLDGVGDTIDVVVIGAYTGRGRRTGVYGGYLLACYEPHTECYQSLCKCGTGFSDADLQNITDTLNKHIIDAPRPYYSYDQSHAPDVWVSAKVVWEVRCADLSLSPAHRAAIGLVANDKGVSLRFPRFIRVRDDKTPEQATTAQQIAEMYLAQDQVKNTNKNKKDTNFDDFY